MFYWGRLEDNLVWINSNPFLWISLYSSSAAAQILYQPPWTSTTTHFLLHIIRVVRHRQCTNRGQSSAIPFPPPLAANHSDEEEEKGFSLHHQGVVGCQRRRIWESRAPSLIAEPQVTKGNNSTQWKVSGSADLGCPEKVGKAAVLPHDRTHRKGSKLIWAHLYSWLSHFICCIIRGSLFYIF